MSFSFQRSMLKCKRRDITANKQRGTKKEELENVQLWTDLNFYRYQGNMFKFPY